MTSFYSIQAAFTSVLTGRRISLKSPPEAGVSRWNRIFLIRPLLPALEIKYSASLIWGNPHCFRFDRVQMAPRDILCLPFLLLVFASHTCKASEEPLVSRIAFGSCANQSAPQPIWNAIINFDPQLFIWLGDNIYGDTRRPFKLFGKERTIGPWKNAPRFVPVTEPELQFRFNKAKNNPGYSRLRERSLVIGTWDDHDYGLNDAGKEFSGKNISQRLLLDFLDEAQDSARRKQAGVYASYMFGPEGKQIKVILLDTRYHRDPLFSDGTILGDSQWKWLEKELNGPISQITIIASSIQRDDVFFISGDVHFGEIARYDCGIGYSLYDITSSGLTQAVEKAIPSPLVFLVRVAAWLTPTTMRVFNHECQCRSCTYGQPNFGTVEIGWDANPVTIKVDVRDISGDPTTSVKLLLSELQTRNLLKPAVKSGEVQHHCSLEIDLPWFIRYRFAIIFYGALSVLVLMLMLLIYAVLSASGHCFHKLKLD